MRVYKYGLLAPTSESVTVRRQMRLAHDYRNTLVQIERGRRTAIREAMRELSAVVTEAEREVREADARLAIALADVKRARAATRTRGATRAAIAAVTDARGVHRRAKAAHQQARFDARQSPELIAATDAINDRAADLQRNARAHCGCYWGTYLLVEAEAQASRAMPLYDGAEPNDPRFARWTGEGRVGVQIQNGMAAEEIHQDSDTRIRISPVDERAWHSESRGERRLRSRSTLSLRVGSDGRAPVWATWPMIMHRPLPAGSRIKCATVNLRRCGGREEWTVCITVDDSAVLPAQACGHGAVSVDLGWRLLDGRQPVTHPDEDGVRVGSWLGEDGANGTIDLSFWWTGGIDKTTELRSIRDRAFDLARGLLAAWLRDRQAKLGSLTLRDRDHQWRSAGRLANLVQWRSAGRLANLVQYWTHHRFVGDDDIYPWLEAWRYHDDHLWRWESNQRQKSLRARREHYRVVAAGLARRYRTLVLETFDMRKLAVKAPPEAAADVAPPRAQRVLVAPAELRMALRNAFLARGGEVVEVPAHNTTRECHACHGVCTWDQAAELRHTCEHCGAQWDQDESAAANILARHRGAGPVPEGTPPKEDRWVKARRLRAERLARANPAAAE